jgi:hypothetical protein
MEQKIWSKRYGAKDMEQKIWSKRYGAKDMEQKIWSKRYGVSEKYRRDYGAKKMENRERKYGVKNEGELSRN